MTNITLIQSKLPQNLWESAQNFTIDDNSLNLHADLIVLILNSRSLADNSEKQNWFNLLTIMDEEQIAKLQEILTLESQEADKILNSISENPPEQKKEQQESSKKSLYYRAQAELGAKENQSREKELEEADSLLAQI